MNSSVEQLDAVYFLNGLNEVTYWDDETPLVECFFPQREQHDARITAEHSSHSQH